MEKIDIILNRLRQASEVMEDMNNDPWLKERRAKNLCTCICHQPGETTCSWCWKNDGPGGKRVGY
jgi:hypothetical protein